MVFTNSVIAMYNFSYLHSIGQFERPTRKFNMYVIVDVSMSKNVDQRREKSREIVSLHAMHHVCAL